MNGVINIYKEAGYTSFHVVYALRRITGESKVGHTGTLDPEVSGVLPVCLGKATKLVGQLTDTDKIYRCRMQFGKRTDTQDLTGQVLEEIPAEEVWQILTEEKIIRALKGFEGETEQIPPMYSALKVDGVKLVNAARRGVEIERKPRKITIYSITDIRVSEDLLTTDFTVHCSKGTYVRTLCEDVGTLLGVPACMERLERTYASGLDLSSAITLDQASAFAKEGTLEEHVIGADRFLMIYPALTVKDDFVRKLIFGNQMMPENIEKGAASPEIPDQIYRVYDGKGIFYALYQYDTRRKFYKCLKMFRDVDE